MKTRNVYLVTFILLFNCIGFAKAPDPICLGPQTEDFPRGDGTSVNPFLVCTLNQFSRISSEFLLLDSSFIQGIDLDFDGQTYNTIGVEGFPFTGEYDGNGYVLSNIDLPAGAGYSAPFAYIRDARIENVTINNITLDTAVPQIVGGLVGLSENAVLLNNHIHNLTLKSSLNSGGLVGHSVDTTITQSSAEGTMLQTVGAVSTGGLIGHAQNSTITVSYANVNHQLDGIFGNSIADLGGLIGKMTESRARDVYAIGNIIFSNAGDTILPQRIGGLVGNLENSRLSYAYYAGVINLNGAQVGGAVGAVSQFNVIERVFWDKELSGVNTSAAGIGQTTLNMKKRKFWITREFDQSKWRLVANRYPTLKGVME